MPLLTVLAILAVMMAASLIIAFLIYDPDEESLAEAFFGAFYLIVVAYTLLGLPLVIVYGLLVHT